MNRIKILSVFVIGILAITITLGAVVYRSASASPALNQETETSGDEDTTGTKPSGKGHGVRQARYSDEDLAAALGISVDDLTAARQKAYDTALAQAVVKEVITQAQADELAADGKRVKGWLAKNGFDYNALLAEALDVSLGELQEAYTQAYNVRIAQAVVDGSLTQEQADLRQGQYALRGDEIFLASMQAAFEAAVKQAVDDGVITQAQADQVLANVASKGTGSFLDLDGAPGPGGRGGRHGDGHYEKMTASAPVEDLESETTTP